MESPSRKRKHYGFKLSKFLDTQKSVIRQAGVPEGLCGLPEVTKFQQVMDDYQIIVLSAEHFNAIVFEGPKREKQIYLYLCNNHYDVITSVSSFLGRTHWCLDCKKGYDRKEDRRCNKACKCCFTVGCQGVTENAPWRECGQFHICRRRMLCQPLSAQQ